MTTTHGIYKLYPSEYKAWWSARSRCNNPDHNQYPNYGGRGVAFCERWLSLESFIEDMGPRPSPEYTLDRINNDRGYSPCNCRWAKWKTQNRNKRDTTAVFCNGETYSVSRWAEILGLPRTKIFNRLRRGWPVDQALGFTPRVRPRSG